MPSDFEINNIWATSTPVMVAENVTVPSGQTCRAKRLGMEGLIESGILGDADSLTAFVGRKYIIQHKGGKGKPDTEELNVGAVLKDPDALKKMVMLCDRALPVVVEQPEVKLHFVDAADGSTVMIPPDGSPVTVDGKRHKRDKGAVYTDQVGLEDKVFLFNFAVGGTRDIERFRGESAAAMAGVGHGEDIPRPAKRTAGGPRGAKTRR